MEEAWKRLYNILFPPECPELESIEEIYEEEVSSKPYLKGHMAEEDQKVTLKAYPQEYRTRIEAIPCTLIFEH